MEKSIHVVQYYFSLATFIVFVWINDLKTIIRCSWEVIGGILLVSRARAGSKSLPLSLQSPLEFDIASGRKKIGM